MNTFNKSHQYYGSLLASYTDKFSGIHSNSGRDAGLVLNFTLHYQLSEHILISLKGSNLLDEDYAFTRNDTPNVPISERQIHLGLRWSL